MADWEANKSSKMDALIKILLYHLAEDNRAPLSVDDTRPGENHLIPDPTFVPIPRGPNSRPDHLVIYASFPSNNPMIVTVRRSVEIGV